MDSYYSRVINIEEKEIVVPKNEGNITYYQEGYVGVREEGVGV